MILNKYRNNLLSIVQESGLDPNLFDAEEEVIDKENYFTISLRDSKIRYAVQPWRGSFSYFACRSSQFRADFEMTGLHICPDFESVAQDFKTWLEEVVKPYLDNLNTPDLWQILGENRAHIKSELATLQDFEAFSAEEKIRIRLSLKDFRLLIVQNFNPNKEELESIDARLKYLSDAVEKHNKFDWKGIAINTVIAIVVALSLNPQQASQLFQFFKQVFSNLIYLLP